MTANEIAALFIAHRTESATIFLTVRQTAWILDAAKMGNRSCSGQTPTHFYEVERLPNAAGRMKIKTVESVLAEQDAAKTAAESAKADATIAIAAMIAAGWPAEVIDEYRKTMRL